MHRGRAVSTRALLSHADGSDQPIDLRSGERARIGKDELLWIDLESPTDDELTVMREALDLGELETARLGASPGSPRPSCIVTLSRSC